MPVRFSWTEFRSDTMISIVGTSGSCSVSTKGRKGMVTNCLEPNEWDSSQCARK